ncbi:MAG: 4a-hydroxytetrahydrobiopterin dehydratase [Nanoarchaeota archaeon]
MTGKTKKLTQQEIKTRLSNLDNWVLVQDRIEKQLQFKSFESAINFVNQVAEIAKQKDHHPDMTINYNKVTLALKNHKSKTLTRMDFDVAQEIDKLFHK